MACSFFIYNYTVIVLNTDSAACYVHKICLCHRNNRTRKLDSLLLHLQQKGSVSWTETIAKEKTFQGRKKKKQEK